MSYTILELPHKMQLNQYLLNGVTLKVKNARCIDGEFVNEHQCRKQGGGKAPKYQYLDGCTFSSQNGKVYAVTKKGNKKVFYVYILVQTKNGKKQVRACKWSDPNNALSLEPIATYQKKLGITDLYDTFDFVSKKKYTKGKTHHDEGIGYISPPQLETKYELAKAIDNHNYNQIIDLLVLDTGFLYRRKQKH